jgi:ABC-2 type transport system permease protein
MRGNFENTVKLTGFFLRRERVNSTVWVLALLAVIIGLVPGLNEIMVGEDMNALVSMMQNPTLVSMVGPAIALINNSYGALYTNFMLVFTALTVGIMNIFLVVRHTRADEELGRYEVVRSLPTGRLAHLNATFMTAIIVNTVLAVLMGLGMYAVGDASMTFNGSMLWGAALGATGLVFAAFTALFSQLSSNARGAMAYSFIALILFFFLRGAGDMQMAAAWDAAVEAGEQPAMSIISLLSPLGMVMRTYAYAGDFWWPIFALLGTAVAVGAIAFKLNAMRDIDQGFIPARPGRSFAKKWLVAPHARGLTFKLTKNALIGCIIGMFFLGASYASILGDVDEFVARNDMYQGLMLHIAGIEIEVVESPSGTFERIDAWVDGRIIRTATDPEEIVDVLNYAVDYAGFTVQDLFASMIMNMMALMAMVPVLLFVLRARAEERAIRTELLLAASVCKIKYLKGFALMAFIAAPLLQFMLAVGLYGTGVAIVGPDILSFTLLLEAALVYVPALWVMAAITILLVGVAPKAAGLIWAYFTFNFLLIFVGRMGDFPGWLLKTAPMGWVPQIPVDQTNWLVMGGMILVAFGLCMLGFECYRRRDINAVTN